ncbi:MAG: Hsp70 family protein [Reinekea sp.]
MICGLDFGTSNSTVGVLKNGQATMVPLEFDRLKQRNETTLPSALFFDFETDNISFGRQAIADYTRGEFGRLMRAMKSILGSNQMDDGTQIKHKVYSFNDIIGFFVNSLKERSETFLSQSLTHVVMGRPVHFNDTHPELDAAAENRLEQIARQVGFKEVSFQFEPIAAAYDYEQQVDSEELALIIDIGGGTSDFTLIRLSKSRSHLPDRTTDLLANHGVHIGGTDFDRHLSLATVMPHFGMGIRYKDKPELSIPKHYFVDLATWHRIHLLYDAAVIRDLNELLRRVQQPAPLQRLLGLLQQKDGHRLASSIEQTKIELSDSMQTEIDLSFLSEAVQDVRQTATQQDLAEAIETDVSKVFSAVHETLQQAGLTQDQVQTVFTTGGSTALPPVKALVQSTFAHAKWVSGDLFNSVGKGLLLEAQRRYLL